MIREPFEVEEMARRHDEDFIASLNMIGEGGPNFDSFEKYSEEVVKVEEEEFPETYQ